MRICFHLVMPLVGFMLVAPSAVGQDSASKANQQKQSDVVVLDSNDFEQVPEAVRGQSLAGTGSLSSGVISGSASASNFDPRRDAGEDIRGAVAVASKERKHVLLEVGGNWCKFCEILDQFFDQQTEVTRLREQNYIYVKVNFSQENPNEKVLGKYPPIRGYPHFFVLDGKGNLVRSQRVALLGTNTGYDPERFKNFLQSFAPRR